MRYDDERPVWPIVFLLCCIVAGATMIATALVIYGWPDLPSINFGDKPDPTLPPLVTTP
jgi:hypothetical protein